jgi:hypothetical protein
MKTTHVITVLSALALCAFRSSDIHHAKGNRAYQEVRNFAWERICRPLNQAPGSTGGDHPEEYFSRCPSGHQPVITTQRDSVRTDSYVNGRILYYRGCSGKTIAEFKVNMAMNFVMIREGRGHPYMSVSEWAKRKTGVKEERRVVKG